MTTFSLGVKAFADKAGANAELVLRKIVLDVASSVILMSPVDTGRFRGNWQFGIGSASTAVDAGLEMKIRAHLKTQAGVSQDDKAATAARAAELSQERVAEGVSDLRLGQIAYLSNNLPYARRLEYGWSSQAPEGMVRVTVARYKAIVDVASGGSSQEVNYADRDASA